MDGRSKKPLNKAAVQKEVLPGELSTDSTVLVATAGEPSQYAVSLQVLCLFGNTVDTAFVVTTTESASETLETYERLGRDSDRPVLGLVDTTASQPSAAALYDETSVIFIPSPGIPSDSS